MSSYQGSVNFYSVLGVSRDASTKEINLAFKRLALKLHPDKSGGDRASIEQFCLTQEAVETLRDPERRRRHDESLSGALSNINHKHEDQPWYNGTCGSRNKNEKNEWNNGSDQNPPKTQYTNRAPQNEHSRIFGGSGSDRNPLKPQYTSRGAPNRQRSGEWGKESESSSPKQQYKSLLDMWGPFIHAYNARPPRPILKAPMTIRPLKPTGEGEDESKSQPAAVEPETQKAPAEPQRDKTQTPTVQGQHAEETVKDVADGPDTTSDEPLDSNGNSSFHDSTDYESMGESCPDDHLSGHVHSWAASGYDSSSESGGVFLPSEFDEAQEGEDDTMHTMYYDCTEHLEHDSTEADTSSMDEESTDDKTEESSDDKADEDADDKTNEDAGLSTGSSNLWPTLRPFVPYFDGKLQNSQARYTNDDMLGEMRGLFLEPYRGWLESARLRIPGERETYNSSDPELCEHRGLWAKKYGCPECPWCGLYQPLYTLTCPSCGKQACIRCKFDERSTGPGTDERVDEAP